MQDSMIVSLKNKGPFFPPASAASTKTHDTAKSTKTDHMVIKKRADDSLGGTETAIVSVANWLFSSDNSYVELHNSRNY